MQKWKINIKSAAKIGLAWRRNKQPKHHSDYLRNIGNLIKRQNPLNSIARTNGFCNSRLIWELNTGKSRIANRKSALANKATMNILIIAWQLTLQDTFLVFRLFGMLLVGSVLLGLKSQHEKVIISIITNLSSFHLYFQRNVLSSPSPQINLLRQQTTK